MKPIHIYTSRTIVISLRDWFRQSLLTFINQHAEVFEALTRATPFGVNWLPVPQHPTQPERIKSAREHIADLQQQLDKLDRIVALLSESDHSGQLLARPSAPRTSEIGINRFRTLQAQP